MKVIVAGGRDFNNLPLMQEKLTEILGDVEPLEIVSGMARGADMLAYKLAKANDIPTKEFPADWKDMSEPCAPRSNAFGRYNAMAGMKRNMEMGDYADMLIAFSNGSSGTQHMIDYMNQLNKPTYIIGY
jgi:hypothetical protein